MSTHMQASLLILAVAICFINHLNALDIYINKTEEQVLLTQIPGDFDNSPNQLTSHLKDASQQMVLQRPKRHSGGLGDFLLHIGSMFSGRHGNSRHNGDPARKKPGRGSRQGSDRKKPVELFYKTSHGLVPASSQMIRLRGSRDHNEGRVEVFKGGRWGLVCDSNWDLTDAHIVCKQLGYVRGALAAVRGSRYGTGLFRKEGVVMGAVGCEGVEWRLQDCDHASTPDCPLDRTAGVMCALNDGCPTDWVSAEGLCYRLVKRPASFQVADQTCSEMDATLLTVESDTESNFISNWLMAATDEVYFRTAGVRVSFGRTEFWKWHRTPYLINYTKWFPGWPPHRAHRQPSNHTGQNCIVLGRKFFDVKEEVRDVSYYYWNDASCTIALPFVCQRVATFHRECYEDTGERYRGKVFRTKRGTRCLKWTSSQRINPSTHPHKGLGNHNFCRNPDNDTQPWCWVDVVLNKFGYCALLPCMEGPDKVTPSPPGVTTVQVNLTVETPVKCSRGEFACHQASGDEIRCVPLKWVCDGNNDCSDAEDEAGCADHLAGFNRTEGHKLPVRCNSTYSKGTYMNMTPMKCAKICLESRQFVCRSFNFKTVTSQCNLFSVNIAMIQRVRLRVTIKFDYYELISQTGDCSDDGHFLCESGKCIDQSDVCNGFDNCNDFSDEQHCHNQSSVSVRLSEGKSEHEGRVEVQYLGEWGVICDDRWDIADANVVCRQLGYHGAIRTSGLSEFGSGNGNFLLDEVNCLGNETALEECGHDPWRKHDCRMYEAAGVVCKVAKGCHLTEEFQCDQGLCVPLSFVCNGNDDCGDRSDERHCDKTGVRLEGGANATQGRVVLTRNGINGTVCDDRWGDSEAKVICRMLGIPGLAVAVSSAHFGAGSGVIWLDDVDCDGSETDVKDCQHLDWANHNCGHGEDAGVICGQAPPSSPPPTTAAPTPASGGVCGMRPITPMTTRIYGGKSAIYGAYPWQASILKRDRFNVYKHSCGGTILNDKWILSAAHCYVNRPKELFRVRVGDSVKSQVESSEQEFAVEELIPHPHYSRITHTNDIALVKVKPVGGSSIKFSDHVQPACLPDANTDYSPGLRCHISGWGSVGWSWFGHTFPDKLRAAVVPIIPPHVCQQLYKGTLTSTMFCAGYIAGNVDTCQGDSGGPFVCKVKDVYTALGVVSWGQGCAEAYAPGVYTKVKSHRVWLDRTMAGERVRPPRRPRFFWDWTGLGLFRPA